MSDKVFNMEHTLTTFSGKGVKPITPKKLIILTVKLMLK